MRKRVVSRTITKNRAVFSVGEVDPKTFQFVEKETFEIESTSGTVWTDEEAMKIGRKNYKGKDILLLKSVESVSTLYSLPEDRFIEEAEKYVKEQSSWELV